MEKQSDRERGGWAGATDTHHYLCPSLIEFVSAPVSVSSPNKSFKWWRFLKRKQEKRKKKTLCVFLQRYTRTVFYLPHLFKPIFHPFLKIYHPNMDLSFLEVSLQLPLSPYWAWDKSKRGTDRHRREKKQQGTESVEDRADFISFLNLRHPEAPAKCPQSCTSSFLNFLVSLRASFPAPLLVDHTLHPGPHQD